MHEDHKANVVRLPENLKRTENPPGPIKNMRTENEGKVEAMTETKQKVKNLNVFRAYKKKK